MCIYNYLESIASCRLRPQRFAFLEYHLGQGLFNNRTVKNMEIIFDLITCVADVSHQNES
jgi:hypothetical protein